MAKALAVERLMPAKQWMTMGALASQVRLNSRSRTTDSMSGAR